MKLIMKDGKLDSVAANVCGIYGWKFPDGKWLIGYSRCIKLRARTYISTGMRNVPSRVALEKLGGWPMMELYILETCDNDEQTLLLAEAKWSEKLNSHVDGYNVAECGVKSDIVGKEHGYKGAEHGYKGAEHGYKGADYGYLGAEGGKSSPRPKYDDKFKKSVSEAMVRYHAERRKNRQAGCTTTEPASS